MKDPEIVLSLPSWIKKFLAGSEQKFPNLESRMKLVIALARKNIEHKTGGPFGAGIFEQETGRLIAVGVNLVESTNYSIAHAEIIAILFAQHVIGNYDLGSLTGSAYELVTSTEPCVMCLGAICWSGVGCVVCGARDDDAREIGFDEGPKPKDWVSSLESRGIRVVKDVLRQETRAVLKEYHQNGGLIYNSHRTEQMRHGLTQ